MMSATNKALLSVDGFPWNFEVRGLAPNRDMVKSPISKVYVKLYCLLMSFHEILKVLEEL